MRYFPTEIKILRRIKAQLSSCNSYQTSPSEWVFHAFHSDWRRMEEKQPWSSSFPISMYISWLYLPLLLKCFQGRTPNMVQGLAHPAQWLLQTALLCFWGPWTCKVPTAGGKLAEISSNLKTNLKSPSQFAEMIRSAVVFWAPWDTERRWSEWCPTGWCGVQ